MNADPNSPLNQILEDLKSDDEARQLAAIATLGGVRYSSEAVVLQLEKLALGKSNKVGRAALEALSLKTSQFVTSRWTSVAKNIRQTILDQIAIWADDGLLEPHRAGVISRRYDFDIRAGVASHEASITAEHTAKQAQKTLQATPEVPAQPRPQPKPAPAPIPAQPARTLAQTLFSEASIRIYLYLGAFLVIGAAAYFAAIREAARLPILLVASLIFASGAMLIKKRLPTPSFALAIIFSFLLPIDAIVFAQRLNLSAQGNEVFWAVTFLIMFAVWAFGVRIYESRAFTLASFGALGLAALRLGGAFGASVDAELFLIALINVLGLAAVSYLGEWKDSKFSLPLFIMAQLQNGLILFISLSNIGVDQFTESASVSDWLMRAFTWILAGGFFAASNLMIPFAPFPWAAVGSLYLVPWLFLSAFNTSTTGFAIGYGVWGVLAASLSEPAQRSAKDALKQYHFPLLLLSLPLFLTSLVTGFTENVQVGFSMFLLAAIAYGAIHAVRPRGYVWLTALLMGLGAYFTFFNLPFMEKSSLDFSYQLLVVSVLLLTPELFFKGLPDLSRDWRWPPVLLGAIITALNLPLTFTIAGVGVIVFGVYALLFAAYALHLNKPWMGYFATTLTVVWTLSALDHFNSDSWLAALTALAASHYICGFFLARGAQTLAWANVLIYSALVLGGLLALGALADEQKFGGWYILGIAVYYVVEMYTRQKSALELGAQILLSAACLRFFDDAGIDENVYLLFGGSLIWLVSDVLIQLTYKHGRETRIFARLIGGALTVAAFFGLADGQIAAGPAAICLGIYTLLFLLSAWVYQQAWTAYLSTFFATATLFFALEHFKLEGWLLPFTSLAVAYFAGGFALNKTGPAWGKMLRYSGLALGTIVAALAVVNAEPAGGWYALVIGMLFVAETITQRNSWFEAGVHVIFSCAAFLFLSDLKIDEAHFILLAISLVWLLGDLLFQRLLEKRELKLFVMWIASGLSLLTGALLISGASSFKDSAIGFFILAPVYALVAWLKNQPLFGYPFTASLALAVYFTMRTNQMQWLLPLTALAVIYYGTSFALRRGKIGTGWDTMLMYSGFALGIILSLVASAQQGGLEKAIPIAVTATFFAAEAFVRRNVWLGFPANAFYLYAYFTLLIGLKVEEKQFYSVGTAVLGMLMHYLLTRAGAKSAAFFTGIFSQVVLLGTAYIQMLAEHNSVYFIILFFEALIVLAYGVVSRSRSLIIAPIIFIALAVVTILYDLLKDLSFVFIIGIPGLILLSLGILGFIMRERITEVAERFSDWDA